MARKIELFTPVQQSQLLEDKEKNIAYVGTKWMAENISLVKGFQWDPETNNGDPSIPLKEEAVLLLGGH